MKPTELEQYKLELIAEQQAEIAAIDRLIARERSKSPGSLNGSTAATGVAATESVRKRHTVAYVVKEAAMQLSGKFTRKHVAERIESRYGTRIPTRSVAVELWKLAREGEIETVKEGRGRTPATYKLK